MNEMFTGAVPHGTGYRPIAEVAKELGFLDDIVAKMLRQTPGERSASIAEIKSLIQKHQSEAVSLQRLSVIDKTVIKSTDIDEPLALTPPRLVDADWNAGTLTLKLDRPVNQEWVAALRNMGSYSSVQGKGPHMFSFRGNQAFVPAQPHEVQAIIDNFRAWLPMASRTLKNRLEQAAQREEAHRREQLRQERKTEEERLRVLRSIKI